MSASTGNHQAIVRDYAAAVLGSPLAELPGGDVLRAFAGIPAAVPLPLLDFWVERKLEPPGEAAGASLTEAQSLEIWRCGREFARALEARWWSTAGWMSQQPSVMLLLGDRGTGKTTLLRQCLLSQCRKLRESPRYALPFYVSLPDLAKDPEFRQRASLRTFLEHHGNTWISGMDAVLETALQPGGDGVLLLLDDLEAVPAIERAVVVRAIREFADQSLGQRRGTAIRVATHPVGYLDTPMLGRHYVAALAPFGDQDFVALVERWKQFGRQQMRDFGQEQANGVCGLRALAIDFYRKSKYVHLLDHPLLLNVAALEWLQGESRPAQRVEWIERVRNKLSDCQVSPNEPGVRDFDELREVEAWERSGAAAATFAHWLDDPKKRGLVRAAAVRGTRLDAAGESQPVASILQRRSPYEPLLHRDLFLAAECVAEGAVVAPSIVRTILERVWNVAASPTLPAFREAAQSLLFELARLPLDNDALSAFLSGLAEGNAIADCKAADYGSLYLRLLQHLGHQPGAHDALWKLVDHRDPRIREVALGALAYDGRDAQALFRLMQPKARDRAPFINADLARLLAEGDRELVSAKLEEIGRTRHRAALIVGRCAEKLGHHAEPLYLELLQSKVPAVCLGAAERLLSTDYRPTVAQRLAALVRSGSPETRAQLRKWMEQQHFAQYFDVDPFEGLNSDDEELRIGIVRDFLHSDQQTIAEGLLVLDHLQSRQEQVRLEAAQALLYTQQRLLAIQVLIQLIGSAEESISREAAQSLLYEELGPDHHERLVHLLDSPHPRARLAAAGFLSETRHFEAVVRAVRPLVRASEPSIQIAAARLVLKQGPDPAVARILAELPEDYTFDFAKEVGEVLMGTEHQHLMEEWLMDHQCNGCGSPWPPSVRGRMEMEEDWIDIDPFFDVLSGWQVSDDCREELLDRLSRGSRKHRNEAGQILLQQVDGVTFLPMLEQILRKADAWPPDGIEAGHPLHAAACVYAKLSIRIAGAGVESLERGAG